MSKWDKYKRDESVMAHKAPEEAPPQDMTVGAVDRAIDRDVERRRREAEQRLGLEPGSSDAASAGRVRSALSGNTYGFAPQMAGGVEGFAEWLAGQGPLGKQVGETTQAFKDLYRPSEKKHPGAGFVGSLTAPGFGLGTIKGAQQVGRGFMSLNPNTVRAMAQGGLGGALEATSHGATPLEAAETALYSAGIGGAAHRGLQAGGAAVARAQPWLREMRNTFALNTLGAKTKEWNKLAGDMGVAEGGDADRIAQWLFDSGAMGPMRSREEVAGMVGGLRGRLGAEYGSMGEELEGFRRLTPGVAPGSVASRLYGQSTEAAGMGQGDELAAALGKEGDRYVQHSTLGEKFRRGPGVVGQGSWGLPRTMAEKSSLNPAAAKARAAEAAGTAPPMTQEAKAQARRLLRSDEAEQATMLALEGGRPEMAGDFINLRANTASAIAADEAAKSAAKRMAGNRGLSLTDYLAMGGGVAGGGATGDPFNALVGGLGALGANKLIRRYGDSTAASALNWAQGSRAPAALGGAMHLMSHPIPKAAGSQVMRYLYPNKEEENRAAENNFLQGNGGQPK